MTTHAPAEERAEQAKSGRTRKIAWRVGLLAVTGVSLYLLLPSLLEVFASWPDLKGVEWWWFAVMGGTQIASLFCVWALQRVLLRTRRWFAVATSQLAGNAFGRIVPGGGATAAALQGGMLIQSGIHPARVASALTSQQLLGFATLTALPVVSLFVILFAGGAVLLLTRRPIRWVGEVIERIVNRIRPKAHVRGLATVLARERRRLAEALAKRWPEALASSVGRWAFDYFTLLAALWAVDARPNPALVLLAYVLSILLSMIPLTPGGLGFVEAGLTGTLALAGVSPGDAVVAALAYRLFSYWLHLPLGLGAYGLFRWRERREAVAT